MLPKTKSQMNLTQVSGLISSQQDQNNAFQLHMPLSPEQHEMSAEMQFENMQDSANGPHRQLFQPARSNSTFRHLIQTNAGVLTLQEQLIDPAVAERLSSTNNDMASYLQKLEESEKSSIHTEYNDIVLDFFNKDNANNGQSSLFLTNPPTTAQFGELQSQSFKPAQGLTTFNRCQATWQQQQSEHQLPFREAKLPLPGTLP